MSDDDLSILHLLQELERIDKLITLNAISFCESEIDHEKDQINKLYGIPVWAIKKREYCDDLQELKDLKQKINSNAKKYIDSGAELRLLELQSKFDLSEIEIDILLICLIGEFDSQYQEMWNNLQTNVTGRYPSIDLVLNLLSINLKDKMCIKRSLCAESPLFKYGLLSCYDATQMEMPILDFTTIIKVDTRIVDYLLGSDQPPYLLSTVLSCETPTRTLQQIFLPQNINSQIEHFVQNFDIKSSYHIILRGKEGSGQLQIAESMCNRLSMRLLIVDIIDILSYPIKEFDAIFSLIQRESLLQNACIYWRGTEFLNKSDKLQDLSLFIRQQKNFTGVNFIALSINEYFPYQKFANRVMEIDIPIMSTEERHNVWQKALPDVCTEILLDIAKAFRLERGHIDEIAKHIISISDYNIKIYTQDEIYKICRKYANRYASNHSKISTPTQKLDDIILPVNLKQELQDIINNVLYRDVVYEKGGFGKKLSDGKGLIALFFGPSGTGKTMAASIIANSLNLSLYKVNLSSVLSKFVGETEKHLDKVFDEAENSNAVLFFDEADSLFGKRGEVQDARDNYANIQTSYLLQKVEEYSGVAILATNFKNNMDAAFVRRLHFSLEFRAPTSEERKQIWKNVWPEKIMLDSNISIDKLSNDLEISGGCIKNIALTASFKAVSSLPGGKKLPIIVKAEHLASAVRKEFRKMGKILAKNQLASPTINRSGR